MKYYVQYFEDSWKTIANSTVSTGLLEYDDLDKAYKTLKDCTKIATIYPMRVTGSNGRVYYNYNPDRDTRRPWVKRKMIKEAAYFLWENAGCPNGREEEFWNQAAKELLENNGISKLVHINMFSNVPEIIE